MELLLILLLNLTSRLSSDPNSTPVDPNHSVTTPATDPGLTGLIIENDILA